MCVSTLGTWSGRIMVITPDMIGPEEPDDLQRAWDADFTRYDMNPELLEEQRLLALTPLEDD